MEPRPPPVQMGNQQAVRHLSEQETVPVGDSGVSTLCPEWPQGHDSVLEDQFLLRLGCDWDHFASLNRADQVDDWTEMGIGTTIYSSVGILRRGTRLYIRSNGPP